MVHLDTDRKFLNYHLVVLVELEMENDNDEDEPVMCSKCNKPFENESEYLQHYNDKHKPENN
jgi:uncharacterized C2H2 Zn-finger protein